MYTISSPNQSISKAYFRDKPEIQKVIAFKSAMQNLLSRIDISESEEFNKNLVAEFFNRSLFDGQSYMVNTYQRTDLAIYTVDLRDRNIDPIHKGTIFDI